MSKTILFTVPSIVRGVHYGIGSYAAFDDATANVYIATDRARELSVDEAADLADKAARSLAEATGAQVLRRRDLGTSANQVVQLTAEAKLPAVDGSLLTNLPASGLTAEDIDSLVELNAILQDADLGTAATHAEEDFATAAQGAAADTAVQPGDLATVATTGAYADLSGKPTLGTAAALNVGTSANEVIQLTGATKLPAVDGSLLTNLPAGGLTKFTEAESISSPNGTVYVDSLTAAGASTNVDIAIVPKGTGALIAAIPDSTTTGGNKRGTGAIDWQRLRSDASQVASGNYSVISGGRYNTASGIYASVGGGSGVSASGGYAFIGSGINNVASGGYAFIGSGSSNAAGDFSAVVGGLSNTADGTYATIGGGANNRALGSYSAVLGGANNKATAPYSAVSGGYLAVADKHGQSSHAAGMFSDYGDAQASDLVCRISTVDATPNELFLDGSSLRCTIGPDTTWAFTITVVARRTDADNESAAYKFEGCIDRNTGTSAALVGSVTKTVIAEDTAAWDCDVTADSANSALIITVTGEAAKTIRWVARIELTEVTG